MCSLISDLHCLHFHSKLYLNRFFILQRKCFFSQWKTSIYSFGSERVHATDISSAVSESWRYYVCIDTWTMLMFLTHAQAGQNQNARNEQSDLCLNSLLKLLRYATKRRLTLSWTSPCFFFFTCPQYKSFENTVRNGEIACNEQFLLFPQCFLSLLSRRHLHQIHNCRLETLSFLTESKICRLGKD